ncbi:penicillin amidase [Agromyces terreus]|uniref:Lysine N-acyltransferase MbtK n=1 Tax=Agromyces terreus TaxID=424795 RepID=A0A9X2GX91_9MICO|nr:GNAT family N-acetyltransferase [Agromyces terreus]MCP2370297.1 penicillin amidase [Agromyces terreus]
MTVIPDTVTANPERLATGRAGDLVHTAHDPALGTIDVFVLDPDAHLDVIHSWVTQPRAAFWGLGELSKQELRELYAYVDVLDTHHAFLVFRDGTPVVLLQTYEPEHDPVGECYEVEPGDVGLHLFIGDRGAPVDAYTTRISRVLGDFLFASPGAQRLVIEPDVHNEAAVARMTRTGFVPGPVIDLPTKQGWLAFMPRERWERMPR